VRAAAASSLVRARSFVVDSVLAPRSGLIARKRSYCFALDYSTNGSSAGTCESCGSVFETNPGSLKSMFFCGACGAIRSPSDSTTHFDIFGLPCSFNVNAKKLHEKYRELQRLLHPDKFATSSDEVQAVSADASARVNEGYASLRHPMARAAYMLELRGIDALSESGESNTDTELLMEIMELRERVEDAEADAAALDDLRVEMEKRVDDLISGELSDSFEASTGDSDDHLARLTVRLRYYCKIIEEIQEAEYNM